MFEILVNILKVKMYHIEMIVIDIDGERTNTNINIYHRFLLSMFLFDYIICKLFELSKFGCAYEVAKFANCEKKVQNSFVCRDSLHTTTIICNYQNICKFEQ